MKHQRREQRTTARNWRHWALRAGRATATCTISAAVMVGGSLAAVVSPAAAASGRSVQMSAAGKQVAPVAHATGSAWSVQGTDLPTVSQGNLFADSCSSPASCIAVGTFEDASGAQVPLAEMWNGTTWSVQPAPSPAGATDSELHAVSCSSATSCLAVGFSGAQALAEQWNGTTWTILPTPAPAGRVRTGRRVVHRPQRLHGRRDAGQPGSAPSLSPRGGTAPPGPSRPPSTHGVPPRRITTASLAVCRAPRPQPAPLLGGSPRPLRTM